MKVKENTKPERYPLPMKLDLAIHLPSALAPFAWLLMPTMAFFIVLKAVLVAYGKAIIQGFKKNS